MSKVTIAIVYSSGRGHTRAVAEHIAKGVEEVNGAQAQLFEVTSAGLGPDGRWNDTTTLQALAEADAIIFGSPTLMGSLSGLMKLFFEQAFDTWLVQGWKDKIAAGFTNSASRSGDKLDTLMQMAVFAAQMGMIWVGLGDLPGGNRADSTADDVNHLGSWLGLMTQSPAGDDAARAPSAGDRLTAERFGRRIARSTLRWMARAEDFPTARRSEAESARRDRAGLEVWRTFDD
jgi:NAD(P)H dehydrogenase (quinone)